MAVNNNTGIDEEELEFKPVNHLMVNDENINILQPTTDTQYVYPRYPNYDFLQVEEINQAIYNFTKNGFNKISCIYTDNIFSYLSTFDVNKSYSKGFKNLRYNFCILSMSYNKSVYTWTIEVHNTLWNGNWYLQNNDGTEYIGDYTSVWIDENTLQIKGKNLKTFRICLELSTDSNSRIMKSSVRFSGNYEYTQQYDLSKSYKCTLINTNNDKPVCGYTVKLVPLDENGNDILSTDTSEYLKSYSQSNCDKGKYNIKYHSVKKVGTYYARLEAWYYDETDGKSYLEATQPVTIHMIQNYSRNVSISNDNLSMYKGEIKTITGTVNAYNKYGVANQHLGSDKTVNIYHTYYTDCTNPLNTNTQYVEKTDIISTTFDENGEFSFEINNRGNYSDKSKLVISLPATENYPSYVSNEFTINREWYVADDYNDIVSECNRENGADAIVLENKTYTRPVTGSSITINRESSRRQYILGSKGKSWSTIDGASLENCFYIKTHTNEVQNELILRGIQIKNCMTAVKQEKNTVLNAVSCIFRYNKSIDYQGVCVYQEDTSCITDISNSYFDNNYANCIYANGIVQLDSNLFKITDVKYTYQPKPFCLMQRKGKGTLTNNQFYVNTSLIWDNKGKPSVKIYNSNRSYAKIAVHVGKSATVNGKNVSQLKGSNTFNYFDNPYNNKGYIFCAYYYPYNIRANIVASADNKHINCATGHAVEGKNWAYPDGYTMTRVSWNKYNTYNPFVTFKNGKKIVDPQILVPESGGVI